MQVFNKENLAIVSKKLIAKTLNEFHYEGLIKPSVINVDDSGISTLQLKINDKVFTYKGKKRIYGNYVVDPNSVTLTLNGQTESFQDILQLCLDIAGELNVSDFTKAYFLEEMNSTIMADLHLLQSSQSVPTSKVAKMTYEEIEGEIEAHPWVIFNKGRKGFSYSDYKKYAPESKEKINLFWIAIKSEHANYAGDENNRYETLINEELSASEIEHFNNILKDKNVDPNDYMFMPVHPWQWDNMIVSHFNIALANNDIIALDYGKDNYLAQQSIRTLSNISDSNKRFVKTCMTIFNTAVWRGLPKKRILLAPELSTWLKNLIGKDEFIAKECGLGLMSECAGIQLDQDYYFQIQKAPYQYKEMLGITWREPLCNILNEGERALPLSSLIHIGADNIPVVKCIIEESNLSVKEWTKRFHEAMLYPLLHTLVKYGVVFSPHGQNAVIVLKDNVPTRMIIKDFADDVHISIDGYKQMYKDFPAIAKGTILESPPEVLIHFIQTTLFICHYRYLSDILDRYMDFSEKDFFTSVRETILSYQQKFPELKNKMALYNFFESHHVKVALNKVRLVTQGYKDDASRPEPAMNDLVENPLVEKRDALSFEI